MPLVVALVGLASIGVVMVASSSIAVADSQHIGAFYFLKRHLLFLSIGMVLASIAMRTELKLLEKHAYLLLGGAIVLLLLVFVPGIRHAHQRCAALAELPDHQLPAGRGGEADPGGLYGELSRASS